MQHIVFDFDGPVFDGRAAAGTALDATISNFESTFGRPRLSFSTLPLFGPKTLVSMLYPNLDRSERHSIVQYYREQLHVRERELSVRDEVRSALDALKKAGVGMAIFSARSLDNLEPLLNDLGLSSYFLVPLGCGPKYPKPAGDYLRYVAANQFRADPKQVVFIGDSDWDYLAAKDAKVWYYHAAWTGEPNAQSYRSADLVLHCIGDLAGLFLRSQNFFNAGAESLNDLFGAVENKRFSFCAGAGISVPSGMGGWEDHYRPIMAQLSAGFLEKEPDLPEVLQLLAADPQRASKVFNAFRDSFEARERQPNEYHFAMLRSDADHIWTSNYDTLFEDAATLASLKRKPIRDDDDLLKSFREGRLIIKMNGDFRQADFREDLNWGMVFLQEQFDKAERDRPEVWQLFEDDYRQRSIIFVGISFKDPLLRRIVAMARGKIPGTRCNHYLITKREEEPAAAAKQAMFAENLRRSSIIVLLRNSHDDIMQLVQEIALKAFRPIIGFSGNVGRVDESLDPKTTIFPGLAMTANDIERVCLVLGSELARKGYRITSGGASFVGIPAVEAAFMVDPTRARFYLRRGGGTSYRRTAPAVVVQGTAIQDMRARFIPELSALIAIAGRPNNENEQSGTLIEIDMAIKRGIPVVLIPAAGGDVHEFYTTLRERMLAAYKDNKVRKAIADLNDEIRTIAAPRLMSYARYDLPSRVEDLLRTLMGSSAPVQRSPSALEW
jgi:HAD superfamily hydrolase (TIGR01509 family)